MREKFTRRRLPHWDQPGATYFVTTCLLNSIPAQGLLEIEQLRAGLKQQVRPSTISVVEWRARQWKQLFARADRWLDHHPSVSHLADARLAGQVADALQFFAGQRYDLIAWVVMPSHIHWVFQPLDEWVKSLGDSADERSPRERISHSINRHTARKCNELLELTGGLWQRESYDHCVRDEGELERIVAYIHANPVRGGLIERAEDYPYSSARDHARREGRAR
jgi:type I restriction enzyme R subunit